MLLLNFIAQAARSESEPYPVILHQAARSESEPYPVILQLEEHWKIPETLDSSTSCLNLVPFGTVREIRENTRIGSHPGVD